MSDAAARMLADAMRAGHKRHQERVGRPHARGEILSLAPLVIDLQGMDMQIGADQVEFGVDVQRFDVSEGLGVGDVLVLAEMAEGDWVATTVLSAKTIRPVA